MSAAIRNNKNTGATRKTPSGLQDNNPPRRTPAWRGSSHPPPSVYAPPSTTNAKYQQPTPSQFPPLGNTSPSPNPASPPPTAPSAQPPPPSSSTSSVSASDVAPDTPLPPSTLIGQSIIVTTRTGQRYQGALVAVPPAADAESPIVLKDVRDLASSTPNNVTKENFNLPVGNIAHWHWSNPSSANGLKMSLNGNSNEFRTDGDISQTGNSNVRRFINNVSGPASGTEGRDLQAWQPDAPASYSGSGFPAHGHLRGDEATFGPGAAPPNGSWDQFAANERMFGVKTSFNEELYTTKLDRNTPDYKERERKAMAIAQEIMSSGTSNPHIAEERNIIVDDSGANEEDKYAGVIRGANAYVPPARRAQQQTQPVTPSQNQPGTPKQGASEVPKVSVSSDGSSATTPAPTVPTVTSGGTSPTPTPSPSASVNASSPSNRPPADLTSTFRDFVAGEKQRLTQKRAAIVKSEMDKRMSELVKFSRDFKLNKPIPEDLLHILAKDESKQQQIRDKAAKDAANGGARAITGTATGGTGVGIGAGPRVVVPVGAAASATKKAGAGAVGPAPALNHISSGASTVAVSASTSPAIANAASTATIAASNATNATTSASTVVNLAKRTRITMVIPPIPPFNPNKSRGHVATTQSDKEKERSSIAPILTDAISTAAGDNAALASPLPKLNINAPAFRLKPGAPPFKPSTPVNTSSPSLPPISSPAPAPAPAPSTQAASSSVSPANAFFGTRVLKKGAVVHVKDDFNPFKTGLVGGKNGDAASVSFNWPYTGKRFMLSFPNLPPPPSAAAPAVPSTVPLHHPPHGHSHASMSPGGPMMPLNMGMMGGMTMPPGAVPGMPGVSGMNMGVTLIPPGTPNLAAVSVSTSGAPTGASNGPPGTSATGGMPSTGQGPTTPGAPPGAGIPNQQPPSGGAAPPSGPPGPPPPSYEDDQHRAAVAAAAAYGMVYYPSYGYHGQPLLPPGAPPGSYIPSHYLPPMHYPHMPPNGHPMYAHAPPPMGGIPPQQYMQHPPPGAYPPPPPNTAGRGSMPPTPMQHHAHPYYHSSPQSAWLSSSPYPSSFRSFSELTFASRAVSHAVPYGMMMPPPHGTGSPSAPPPHPYDNAHNAPPQQVPMGHS